MIRQYIAIIFLCSSASLVAQNLVPNPSFEELNEDIPFAGSPYEYGYSTGLVELISPWYAPTKNGPRIISSKDPNKYHSGHIAIRVTTILRTTKYAYKEEARDYVAVQLKQPLIAGEEYRFSMFIKRMENTMYATDRMGVYFSKEKLEEKNLLSVWDLQPQIENEPGKFLYDPNEEWIEFSGIYTALGDEEYIIIGSFAGNKATKYKKVNKDPKYPMADYIIDDVSLIPLNSELHQAKEEEEVNDIKSSTPVVLENIYFELDKAELLPSSIPQLKALAEELRKDPATKIHITGHTDDLGTEEYNLNLSLLRANAVAEFLISKMNIDAGRVSYEGMGNKFPLVYGTNEAARQKNRRVEYVMSR